MADAYANEHQSAWVAARDGVIGEVILPVETRPRLSAALDALSAKQSREPTGGNIPL